MKSYSLVKDTYSPQINLYIEYNFNEIPNIDGFI